jgi:hybrid cluster-associated redox disulfide protein
VCYSKGAVLTALNVYNLKEDNRIMVITKDMPIGQVVQRYPKTVEVFLRHGLMCFGCAIAQYENVEQGAVAHGIDVEVLVKDLNTVVPEVAESEL